jgi:hypothetical protein
MSSPVAQPATARLAVERLFRPVDAAALVLFRRCFGVLMVWQMLHYTLGGRLQRLYLDPGFRFTYAGFAWLPAFPHPVLQGIAWTLLAAAAAIALGWWPRIASATFGLLYFYLLLLDKANYNNHDYLIALLAGLLAMLPLDSPQARGTAPAWALALLRFQIAMPYVFGGIAKLQADWLCRAQPLKIWFALPAESRVPADWLRSAWLPFAVSWSGAVFDLAIVPLLLWRRSRAIAAGLAIAFHLVNASLFKIGVFPWLMIAATGLFFAPGWPRRFHLLRLPRPPDHAAGRGARAGRQAVAAALAGYVALQLFLPLRHLLVPGNVDWTEQGHTFAWRMKIRDKRGTVDFVAVTPDGEPRPLPGAATSLLTPGQWLMMVHDPEMIRQVAVYIAREWRGSGGGMVVVRAVTAISFNGRRPQPMVNPDVDLSELPAGRPSAEWIVPLAE